VVGYFVLLATLGWHPDEEHKQRRAQKPVADLNAVHFAS
jgi:hypothetical protein